LVGWLLTVIPKCSRVRLCNVANLGKSVKRSGFHSSLFLFCDPRVFSSTTQEPLSMDQTSVSATSCAAQTFLEIYLSNIKYTRPRLSGIDIVKLESMSSITSLFFEFCTTLQAAIDDCARVTRCNLLAVDSQQVSRWTIAVCVPHAAHSSVDSKCKLEDLVLYVIFTCSVPTFLNLRTMAVPVVIYEHQNMLKYISYFSITTSVVNALQS